MSPKLDNSPRDPRPRHWLWTPRLVALAIGDYRLGVDAQLLGDKAQEWREHLTG
jgi:hypothetical protein